MEPKIKEIYDKALEACINGKFAQDMKVLYQAPYRNNIDWSLFPLWAVPNAETEGCHEG